MKRIVLLIVLVLSGCGLDLFKPYCDDLGVYPSCTHVNGGWVCPSATMRVCNEGGYSAHYDCDALGGVYCVIR
jgi:hypothetical protein